jgi:hypothetical protein
VPRFNVLTTQAPPSPLQLLEAVFKLDEGASELDTKQRYFSPLSMNDPKNRKLIIKQAATTMKNTMKILYGQDWEEVLKEGALQALDKDCIYVPGSALPKAMELVKDVVDKVNELSATGAPRKEREVALANVAHGLPFDELRKEFGLNCSPRTHSLARKRAIVYGDNQGHSPPKKRRVTRQRLTDEQVYKICKSTQCITSVMFIIRMSYICCK